MGLYALLFLGGLLLTLGKGDSKMTSILCDRPSLLLDGVRKLLKRTIVRLIKRSSGRKLLIGLELYRTISNDPSSLFRHRPAPRSDSEKSDLTSLRPPPQPFRTVRLAPLLFSLTRRLSRAQSAPPSSFPTSLSKRSGSPTTMPSPVYPILITIAAVGGVAYVYETCEPSFRSAWDGIERALCHRHTRALSLAGLPSGVSFAAQGTLVSLL